MAQQLGDMLGGTDHDALARTVRLLLRAVKAIKTTPNLWYWETEENEWLRVVLVDEMIGNGEHVFRIDILDGTPERLAFDWQVKPYVPGEGKPAALDSAGRVTPPHTGSIRSV